VIKPDLDKLVFLCREAVEAILPLVASQVGANAYDAVRAFSGIKPLVFNVSALINGAGESMIQRFAPLKDKTVW
jgi:hypothetical protein